MEYEIFAYLIGPASLFYSGLILISLFEKIESGGFTKIRSIYSIIIISSFWIFVLALYMKYNENRNFSEKPIEMAEALEIISYSCFLIAGLFLRFDRYTTVILILIGYSMVIYFK